MTTQSKSQKDKTMSTTDQLNQSEIASKFGFKFVAEEEVPAPPRARENDTERWAALKTVLEMHPGQWAMVKQCNKAGSASNITSRINGGTFGAFPSEKGWEARSEVTRKKGANGENDEGTSELYVRFAPKVEAKPSK